MFALIAGLLLSLASLSPQGPVTHLAAETREFRISGIVRDGLTGLPLQGAQVSIVPSAFPVGDAVAPVLTSPQGRFIFEHLSAGKYILSAKRRGYAPQNYEQHEGFTTAIAVGPQLDSENIIFPIFPEAAITGRVIDQFGEALRHAQVILFEEGLSDGRMSIHSRTQAQTDDEGRYRFGGLQKGRYYLAVSARPWYAQNVTTEPMAGRPAPDPNRPLPSFRPIVERNASLDVVYPLTFYEGTMDSERASAIVLDPGTMLTADFSLVALPALHLRLTAPGLDLSLPINVSVSQFAFGLPSVFTETTQAWADDESIGIAGVPPGEIRLSAQSVGGGTMKILFNETLTPTEGMEINLNHQARGVPVSGVVKLAADAHLPDRSSLILREIETGRLSQCEIKADGSFDFGNWVVPGKYVPTVLVGGGSGWYVGGVRAEGAQVSGRVVDLQSADPVRLTVEISEGLGRVDGVAQRDGKGFGGAMVLVVSNDLAVAASVVGRDQSDSDGTFAIPNVPPGEYTVLAIQNGWNEEWADPSVMQKWLSGGTAVRIAPNGQPRLQVTVQ